MAYTKTVWVDNQSPDINATNLNHIEQGIYNASNLIDTLNDSALSTKIVLHDTDLDTLENNGIYSIVSNYTYTNCPVTEGGILIVARVSAAAIYQIIFSRLQSSFMRAKMSSTGTWSVWSNIIPIDSTLSTTSENPVQNRVIATALNSKANSSSLATVATSGSYNDLSNKPSLATVATSGSYNDLSNKPTIPSPVTVDSTVTSGGTNPVNSVAILAYINSLDASNVQY